MIDRPSTRAAVTLVNADNGGHLLEFYGVGPSPMTVIDIMMAYADKDRTEDDLIQIEAYLCGLTKPQMEAVCMGGDEDRPDDIPPMVDNYLNDAFEAPVPLGGEDEEDAA